MITAYCKEYKITKDYEELDFVKKEIDGFRTEWTRYCYFEFTKEVCIKPHQRIIVKKQVQARVMHMWCQWNFHISYIQNGNFVTGSGVRHMIIGTEEDGSKPVKPPNLSKHTKWKCVYVQSRDLDRELSSGTTYLFCKNIKIALEKSIL